MSVFSVLTLPNTSKNAQWGNLLGSSLSLAIAETAKAQNVMTLVLTADNLSANQITDELHFFAPDLPIYSLPGWE